jgi:peptide/nickel transport system permease protein
MIIICFILLFAMIAAAVFLPFLEAIDPYTQNLLGRLAKPRFLDPASKYVLGSDPIGRDLLSRTVYGLACSLVIGALGVIIGTVLGVSLGMLSGLGGGILDNIIMAVAELQQSIPRTLILIVVVVLVRPSVTVMIVVLGVLSWNGYARLVRGQILSIREEEYVLCSKALGASQFYIAVKHVLKNIASPIIVLSTSNLSSIILSESTLSFLGVGLQPPAVSLGLMISSGRDHLATSWWLTIIPSIVLALLVITTSLIGDWLRDVLDPQLRHGA